VGKLPLAARQDAPWPLDRSGSGPVRSRTPLGAPVLRDQGPDRPAGHGKADAGLDPMITCSQSQFERTGYRPAE
jgi:hypothetical protein